MATIRRTKHSASDLSYHIVLVIKYRKAILTGDLARFVSQQVEAVCLRYGWGVLALAVLSDHVHLLISAAPSTAPVRIAATLKSIVTIQTFHRFGRLKATYFRKSGLFSGGTWYSAVGPAERGAVIAYIGRQA